MAGRKPMVHVPMSLPMFGVIRHKGLDPERFKASDQPYWSIRCTDAKDRKWWYHDTRDVREDIELLVQTPSNATDCQLGYCIDGEWIAVGSVLAPIIMVPPAAHNPAKGHWSKESFIAVPRSPYEVS